MTDAIPWRWVDDERATQIRRDEQWDTMGWTPEDEEDEDDEHDAN